MRIAVTTSKGRLEALDALLREAGHEAVRSPLIETVTKLDPASARRLVGLPWRVYPSRSAVDAWSSHGLGYESGTHIAAVGPATSRALEDAGASVTLTAPRANAEDLVRAMLRHPLGPRRSSAVGIVEGSRARSRPRDLFAAAGVRVETATLYQTNQVRWQLAGHVDAVVLASPSAVAVLPHDVAKRAMLVALGPTTAAAVRGRGYAVVQATTPTADAVMEALLHNAPSTARSV